MSLPNTAAATALHQALAQQRLPHGILLYGLDLASLETLALELAQALLPGPFPALEHPDCFCLRPTGKMRQIGVSPMRALIKDLQQTANQGGHKVAILYEPDRMNAEAANAFLKTLEEPPAHTTLFLLTTRPYHLLTTIRSRCFNIRIPGALATALPPAFQNWLQQYQHWLQQLSQPPRQHATQWILGIYGLIMSFEHALQEATRTQWEEEKAELSDTLSDEEKIALESGLSKSIRHRFLQEIQRSTLAHATQTYQSTQHFPSQALAQVTDTLEHCAGLLNVNLKENVALEHFLLTSLRAWSQYHSQQ